MTRWLARGIACLLGALILVGLASAGATASGSGADRSEAIQQLEVTRESIDRTLELVKGGKAEQAFSEAKDGYLTHFELVEVPLRVADAA